MAAPAASIVIINVTDRASQGLLNIAGRLERINRSFAGLGKKTGLNSVAAGFGLINEQHGRLRTGPFRPASQRSRTGGCQPVLICLETALGWNVVPRSEMLESSGFFLAVSP